MEEKERAIQQDAEMEQQKDAIRQAAGTEVTFFIPNTESIGKLKDMQPKFWLNMKYKTADDWAKIEGIPQRVYYMGLKEIPNEDGETVTCGAFVSEKECFISGQKLLVDAVRILPVKTPVEIVYRGKSKNKITDGSTMKFDVIILG
ncbi:MAG: hypothetical protein LBH58_04025 [Tannerellaceae bacterium]|jgi:hypothetical protein|nr:hypothetical protein [Tannerellaceae bacterium]